MATCDLIDSVTMEVLGQASSFQNALIDHIIMEVLGFFQFGSVDVQLIVMETLGQIPNAVQLDHFNMEVLGVWDGCPNCN